MSLYRSSSANSNSSKSSGRSKCLEMKHATMFQENSKILQDVMKTIQKHFEMEEILTLPEVRKKVKLIKSLTFYDSAQSEIAKRALDALIKIRKELIRFRAVLLATNAPKIVKENTFTVSEFKKKDFYESPKEKRLQPPTKMPSELGDFRFKFKNTTKNTVRTPSFPLNLLTNDNFNIGTTQKTVADVKLDKISKNTDIIGTLDTQENTPDFPMELLTNDNFNIDPQQNTLTKIASHLKENIESQIAFDSCNKKVQCPVTQLESYSGDFHGSQNLDGIFKIPTKTSVSKKSPKQKSEELQETLILNDLGDNNESLPMEIENLDTNENITSDNDSPKNSTTDQETQIFTFDKRNNLCLVAPINNYSEILFPTQESQLQSSFVFKVDETLKRSCIEISQGDIRDRKNMSVNKLRINSISQNQCSSNNGATFIDINQNNGSYVNGEKILSCNNVMHYTGKNISESDNYQKNTISQTYYPSEEGSSSPIIPTGRGNLSQNCNTQKNNISQTYFPSDKSSTYTNMNKTKNISHINDALTKTMSQTQLSSSSGLGGINSLSPNNTLLIQKNTISQSHNSSGFSESVIPATEDATSYYFQSMKRSIEMVPNDWSESPIKKHVPNEHYALKKDQQVGKKKINIISDKTIKCPTVKLENVPKTTVINRNPRNCRSENIVLIDGKIVKISYGTSFENKLLIDNFAEKLGTSDTSKDMSMITSKNVMLINGDTVDSKYNKSAFLWDQLPFSSQTSETVKDAQNEVFFTESNKESRANLEMMEAEKKIQKREHKTRTKIAKISFRTVEKLDINMFEDPVQIITDPDYQRKPTKSYNLNEILANLQTLSENINADIQLVTTEFRAYVQRKQDEAEASQNLESDVDSDDSEYEIQQLKKNVLNHAQKTKSPMKYRERCKLALEIDGLTQGDESDENEDVILISMRREFEGLTLKLRTEIDRAVEKNGSQEPGDYGNGNK